MLQDAASCWCCGGRSADATDVLVCIASTGFVRRGGFVIEGGSLIAGLVEKRSFPFLVQDNQLMEVLDF
jgi:hypothetical protein